MFTVIYLLILMATPCVPQRRNILLIIIDDLRTSLGCYGDAKAYTPHIDRLATSSAIFSQAFAQQALCAPSRNSFLTSRRPDTLQLYDFYSYWRDSVGNFTTMPQHFKNNGYITKSIGKVFHPGISSNNSDDSPYSWTEVPFHPFTEKYKNAPVCQTNWRIPPARNLVCPVKVSIMPNETLPDIEILKEAKRFIKDNAKNEKPFFLAVGFQKPHIPFKYPKKYLKYHRLHSIKLPDPYKWPGNVSNIAYNPWIDLRKREDIESLNLTFPWEKIPESFGKLIIQSYYSAVTYIDDLIGKLINQIDNLSVRQNTTIILTSDHGWSLGEHAVWAKYSNFDVALRVPLIISIPGLTFETSEKIINTRFSYKFEKAYEKNLIKCLTNYTKDIPGNSDSALQKKNRNIKRYLRYFSKWKRTNYFKHSLSKDITQILGNKNSNVFNVNKLRQDKNITFALQKDQIIIDSLVELVDIFPTIADLENIPIPICLNEKENIPMQQNISPKNKEQICSEGSSLVPLMKAALKKKSLPWKNAVFGQYPRPGVQPSLNPNTDEPRLRDIKAMGYTMKTKKYRYTCWLPFRPETKTADWNNIIAEELYDHDNDLNENQNLENLPQYASVKEELKVLLRRGWKSALPRELYV